MPGLPCLEIHDEADALLAALEGMADGEVVVLFYDELEPVEAVLRHHGAREVNEFEDLPLAVSYRALRLARQAAI